LEFSLQSIPFRADSEVKLSYKELPLKQKFRPDFACFDLIVVEIKAVSRLLDEHRAQVHNYLKATGFKLGLLVNFAHHPELEYERIVR
jgi:GxxExxY protein